MRKVLFFFITICLTTVTRAQLTVVTNSIATQLAQTIAGFGVTISSASLSCGTNASGTFTYTGTHLGLTNGVILATGNATEAALPQSSFSSDDVGNNISDPQLTSISSTATYNLCRLEFDFVPICPNLSIKYVFGSEEYPTFVGSINDAFGIFLTGPNPAGGSYTNQNIALLPGGQAVSINNVNSSSNSSSFIANYTLNYNDIVYGGYTVPITSTASITPCQTYHIKFAIADASDTQYDSGVMIQYDGLSCTNSPTVMPSSTASSCGGNTGSASVSVTGLTPISYSWQPGGQTTSSITNQPPGTYTCVMTFSSGCTPYTQSQTVTIGASGGTGTVAASSNAPCAGNSLNLSTASGTSYTWSGPGGYSSSIQNPTIASPSATNSGVYSVTVTSSGCTSTGTVNVTVNSPPSITMPSTQTITCASPSVNLAGSATPSTCTPVWTGGACAGASSYTASACSAGTYTLTVTDPTTSCSNSGTVSVISSSGVPVVTTSNTGSLTCTTTTAQVVASTTMTPVSYAWTGPGAVSGASASTGTVSTGGTYTCVIINTSSGCSTTVTTNVSTDTVAPVVSITPPSTLTCTSPTLALSGGPSSGVTYTWTGSGIVSGGNSSSPVINQPGTYSLAVTNSVNGCTATANSSVAQNTVTPAITISPSSTLTCSLTTAVINTTVTPASGITYTWTGAGITGSSTGSSINVNQPDTYSLVVTNSANGCTATATSSVTQDVATPTISISPSQTLTCATPTAVINTTVTPAGGMTYSWTGAGITGSSTGSSVNVNQGGSYNVIVTNSVNGCTNTASSTITSSAGIPTATIATVPVNSILTCTNTSVTLNATATPTSITYAWSTGAGTSTTSASSAGVVTLTVTNTANGCSVTAQYTVVANNTPPSLTTNSANIACGSGSVALTASSTNTNVTYSWTGPNAGSIISGNNTSSPAVVNAGNYTVTVTDPTSGCFTTSVIAVSHGTVVAAFTANPTSGIAPLPVSFTNQSTGAVNYLWSFGDGHGASSQNPANTYTATGTYTVQLIASNGVCTDTTYAVIVVDNGLTLEIPNVFTPNGDNINDVFFIKNTGVKDMTLIIYNRWGEKVCDAYGAQASWNGATLGGAKVPDGTYFFMVKATGLDGKTIEKQGAVSLYR